MVSDRFKFRFWNTIRNKYEDTYCCSSRGMTLDYVVPEQCTGLRDKNENLIYEGDIVYKSDFNAIGLLRVRTCRVFWHEKWLAWAIETEYGDIYTLEEYEGTQYEILSNIHEYEESCIFFE